MALVLLTNPPSVLADSSDWTEFLTRENASNLGTGVGITTFRLTNWDSGTTKPAIAEGSVIEVGGSIYQADSNTALTDEGGLTNGTVHIKLVPSGSTVIPTLTNDAIPSWDANKAGWYSGTSKFLPFEMEKSSAVYTNKSEYIDQNKTIKTSSIGNFIPSEAIRLSSSNNLFGSSMNQATAFSFFDNQIPEIGDRIRITGGVYNSFASGFYQYQFSYVIRNTATQISLVGIRLTFTTGGTFGKPTSDSNASLSCNSGSGSAFGTAVNISF
jgi:hypothetical protein